MAEFGGMAALDPAAQHVDHRLLAIADAQHRHAQLEDLGRGARAARLGDAGRAARQDHRPGRQRPQTIAIERVEGMDLGIDVELAQAARDQLRHLAAEIDDEAELMAGHGAGLGRRRRPCKPAAPCR
jgi:hypothetical protein